MEKPLEIHFKDMDRSEATEKYIQKKARSLKRYSDQITHCRISVEQPHRHRHSHAGFTVKLDVTVPPRREISVTRSSDQGEVHNNLYLLIDEAFDAAQKQIGRVAERSRGEVKHHPAPEAPELAEEEEEEEEEEVPAR